MSYINRVLKSQNKKAHADLFLPVYNKDKFYLKAYGSKSKAKLKEFAKDNVTLEYEYNDTIIDSIYVEKNVLYDLPSKVKGIVVDSYLLGEKNISNSYVFTDNCILHIEGNVPTYSINYELNGGINNDANPSSYSIGENVLLNPKKENSFFGGWFIDEEYQKQSGAKA